MALVSHTIISRYTPQSRDPVAEPVAPEDDPWHLESSFGPAERLHSRAAPCFVAASLDYDEYGMPKVPEVSRTGRDTPRDVTEDVSTWYRSVTSRSRAKEEQPRCSPSTPHPPLSVSSGSSPGPLSSKELPPEDALPMPTSCPPTQKPNWFASRPASSQSSFKPSTLADLLSRNPPPLPFEPAFEPPVFLVLGPNNRGYTMLQRKGWEEGEGLGSARISRKAREGLGRKRYREDAFQWGVNEDNKLRPRRRGVTSTSLADDATREIIDLTLSDYEEQGRQDIVDLTLSDSECESERGPRTEPKLEEADDLAPSPKSSSSERKVHGTTLLTPIATTLKADRLGIGLKAARRNTAKAKAVTHTSTALAAHIRSGNQMRKDKKRHGRGSRGFARGKRREERERIDMLAYLKS